MIILDTHAWVRWLHPEANAKLPDKLRTWLETTAAPLAVSVISTLEVAQLVKQGRLELPLTLPNWYDAALAESGIRCLPITPTIAHASTRLPEIHKDRADRIIIATAQAHGARLVTADQSVQRYPDLETIWTIPAD